MPTGNPNRIPLHTCRCGHQNDAATAISDPAAMPGPGDLAVCLYCGCVTQYDENLVQRELTEDEIEAATVGTPSLQQMVEVARIVSWLWSAAKQQR